MKYTFYFFLFFALSFSWGQQKDSREDKSLKKLAILPFSYTQASFQSLSHELLSYITSEFYSDTYCLVERVNIQDIIKEKIWKKTHLEEKDIQEIFDSIESAEYLLIGQISQLSSQWCIEYKFVKMDGSIVQAHRVCHAEWPKAQEAIVKSLIKLSNVQLYCRLQAREFDDFYILESLKNFLHQKEKKQKIHIIHLSWARKSLKTHFFLKEQTVLEFVEEIKKIISGISVKVYQTDITISPD